MKATTKILKAIRFMLDVSPNPHGLVELRCVEYVLANAHAGVRRSVLLSALRELEGSGQINIIKRGTAFNDWDATLPTDVSALCAAKKIEGL